LSFVGGATKFYGAALYRLHKSDFRAVEHENGISPAWPIDYATLEPYYEQAERLFRVHGENAGDIDESSRRASFPYPPLPNPPIVAEMVRRLTRSGTDVSAIPRGIDYGPKGACVLCSTCDAFYCRLDAKMDAEIAAIRPAIATGNVIVATQTECLRVVTHHDGTRVSGVVLRRGITEYTVQSDIVAVCAGIPSSAVLLRSSSNDRHPNGLGNASGTLGRYLGGHSVGMIFPFVTWRTMPPTHTKTFAINQYYHGAPDWPYPTGVIHTAGQMPIWENVPRGTRSIARLIAQHSITCYYMTEALPSRGTGLFFRDDNTFAQVDAIQNTQTFERLRKLALDLFHRAGYRALARRRLPHQWHAVGTARFGNDPASSVADVNCQVRGINGLYVVDASVLPSAGALNTGLTIVALALRAADHISGTKSIQ
jgi:choline dehydrogenase-like flavoprotein